MLFALGGVSAQYLNHAHEASTAAGRVRRALDAPLHVHAADAEEVKQRVSVDEVFDHRHTLGEDLEVIPAPGHTPGATAYLWRTNGYRALFTGDTVAVRGDRWVAAFIDGISNREQYVASLQALAELEFDLLGGSFRGLEA